MKDAIKRWVPRGIHMLFSIPIIGYIYSSPANAQLYADRVRFFFLPVMLLSGLWMWKGHVVRRLIARRSALRRQA
jgi:hypothetical protein